MCGIAGVVYRDWGRPVDPFVLKAMTDAIAHRGPDDEGFHIEPGVGLGHRRLSIIDLSTGRQPIANEDDTCHIVFNGEIYNHHELRRDLAAKGHIFRTKTDTEAILHCYEEYGDDCVSRLNGMFAFAIWDGKRRRLFMARDHLGIKPLFYHLDQDKLLFGSELKALWMHPDVPRELDLPGLDAFFSYMYIPEPHSAFLSIRKLPPAHTLVFENGVAKLNRFWTVQNTGKVVKSEGEWREELTALLEDSVKIQLMSDVPLGVFLSGGIDSSSVVGLMSKFSSSIKTFSMSGGPGLFNELPYAKVVADRYGTEHHELEVPVGDIEGLIPKLVAHLDEPFADSSIIPTYHICKAARERVKVVLSGEGGDEIFAGYTWHKKYLQLERFRSLLPEPFRRGFLKPMLKSSRALGRLGRVVRTATEYSLMPPGLCFENLRRIFPDSQKPRLFAEGLEVGPDDRIWAIRRAYEENIGGLPLDKALFADRMSYLPGDLLTKVDRMSMANSLEVRVPLLDYRIVELAAGMPAGLKLKGKVSKYILKQAMNDVLPEAIKKRKVKRGFSVPVNEWFKGHLKGYAADVLLEGKTRDRGFFKMEGTRKLLDDHAKGAGHFGDQIFSMLIFELWARHHLDAAYAPTKEGHCQPSLSTAIPTIP